MQPMSSQEYSRPDEMAMLGERYQLGAPEGVYYVSYTQADIRRYHQFQLCISGMILYLILIFGGLALMIIYRAFEFSAILSSGSMLNVFMLVYFSYMRRKWGNRPIINAEMRHERIYVYQYGLIKQTHRHCTVARWSELLNIKYTAPQLPEIQNSQEKSHRVTNGDAGLQIIRPGGEKISLSGALYDLHGLASLLSYHAYVTL